MTDELDALVAKMRALGVTRYRDGAIEIELGSTPLANESPKTDEHTRLRLREEMERQAAERKRRIMYGSTTMRPKLGNSQ